MSENNSLLKCMGTCSFWEQVFYQDDPDMEYEKCYDYCHKKLHAVKEKTCLNCSEYECRWTEKEIEEWKKERSGRIL